MPGGKSRQRTLEGHEHASAESRAVCEALSRAVTELDPKTARVAKGKTCTLRSGSEYPYVHIYHRKTSGRIDVWCKGDSASLIILSSKFGVPYQNRGVKPKAWANFPGRFSIDSIAEVGEAARFLEAMSRFGQRARLADRGPTGNGRILDRGATLADEVDARRVFIEGAVKVVHVNRYERDKRARAACLRAHGTTCSVCKFDAASVYGDEFQGLIHVHHVRPLSTIGIGYHVDPKTELIPVCPNCHAAIHARNPPYSADDLRAMLKSTRVPEASRPPAP